MNKPAAALAPTARQWARKSAALNFKQVDRADEDTLNRILWHAAKGSGTAYPSKFAGAHGSGLAKRKLKISAEQDD